MNNDTVALTVQILDKDYRIGCSPGEEEALLSAAHHLDEAMRSIRGRGTVIGADRIAVMAALNIANELLQERNQRAAEAALLHSHLHQLEDRIDLALLEEEREEPTGSQESVG